MTVCARLRLPLVVAATLLACGAASAQTANPAPSSPAPAIRVSGYLQVDFLAPLDDDESRHADFSVRRARLQVAGALDEHVDWTVSAEVSTTPVLRDAYIRLRYWPAMTVRVGQTVMPYGQEQTQLSSNALPFTERVSLALVASRDLGIVVSNERPFFGWLSYAVGIANGTRQNTVDDNRAKDAMLRLTATPAAIPGLRVGINGDSGQQPDGRRDRLGWDMSFERRLYHVAAEVDWQQMASQPDRRIAYLFGVWRLYPRTPRRGFDHLEFGVRFTRATVASAASDQWDLAAVYYVSGHLRFMTDFIVRPDPRPGDPGTAIHARANVRF